MRLALAPPAYNPLMTTVSTQLSDELAAALEHYRETYPDDPEAIVTKALKRFLLEEGFPAEDEVLADEELAALDELKRGSSDYTSWDEIKRSL